MTRCQCRFPPLAGNSNPVLFSAARCVPSASPPFHADELNVQILCAFGIMVGRIFNFQSGLLEFLLLFLELGSLVLDFLDLMHVLFQYPL